MFLKDPRYSRFDENGVPTHEMKEVKPNKKETGKKKKETKCEIEQGKQENQNVNEGEKFEVKNEQGEGKV